MSIARKQISTYLPRSRRQKHQQLKATGLLKPLLAVKIFTMQFTQTILTFLALTSAALAVPMAAKGQKAGTSAQPPAGAVRDQGRARGRQAHGEDHRRGC